MCFTISLARNACYAGKPIQRWNFHGCLAGKLRETFAAFFPLLPAVQNISQTETATTNNFPQHSFGALQSNLVCDKACSHPSFSGYLVRQLLPQCAPTKWPGCRRGCCKDWLLVIARWNFWTIQGFIWENSKVCTFSFGGTDAPQLMRKLCAM